jgi:6-pyruvoyl-tetrahydropterin synthase-like protein
MNCTPSPRSSLSANSTLLFLGGFLVTAAVYLFFLEPWGHDTWFHLQRLADIDQQLEWGHLRAHFAENAAQGKGLPVWIYYSQWVYWPALLAVALGAGPLVALKLVYCASLLVCTAGCYRLLRLHADAGAASFGTLLFMTSNYVVGEVFQRSAYAEFMSVSLLPFVLAALNCAIRRRNLASKAQAALFAAIMILCHPLSFMNSGVLLLAYAAFVALDAKLPPRRILGAAWPLVLALALTAFYWLPAVIETRFVMAGKGARTPLEDTFLSLGSYLNFSGITNLGFVLSLLAAVVALYFVRSVFLPSARRARACWPLVVAVLAYFLLTLRISEPLYDHVSLLAANLWVWRVLFQMTLLVVIVVVVNLGTLAESLKGDGTRAALAAIAVLQAVALVVWNTNSELSTRRLSREEIATQVAIESQRVGDFGIDEYLPNPNQVPRPPETCREILTVPRGGRYEMSVIVAAGDADSCIHIPRFWNTRFEARFDGKKLPVYADSNGEILIAPRGGAGRIDVRFGRPAYVTAASLVSLIALGLLVAMFAVARRRPA